MVIFASSKLLLLLKEFVKNPCLIVAVQKPQHYKVSPDQISSRTHKYGHTHYKSILIIKEIQ